MVNRLVNRIRDNIDYAQADLVSVTNYINEAGALEECGTNDPDSTYEAGYLRGLEIALRIIEEELNND